MHVKTYTLQLNEDQRQMIIEALTDRFCDPDTEDIPKDVYQQLEYRYNEDPGWGDDRLTDYQEHLNNVEDVHLSETESQDEQG